MCLKKILLILTAFAIILLSADVIRAADCRTELERSKRSNRTVVEQISLLEGVIDGCPTYGPALNKLARLYEKSGRFKKAIDFFNRAIGVENAGFTPYAGLGDALSKLGDKKGAADAYRKLLSKLEDEVLTTNPDQIRRYEREYRLKLQMITALEEKNPSFSDLISSSEITLTLTNGPVITRGLSFVWHDKPFIDLQIRFDVNSSNVKPKSLLQLKEIATALHDASLKDTTILIEGHTDSAGSATYNQELSVRRAKSVQQILSTRFGVNISRTQIKGYGENRPIAPNKTKRGRAVNRRVTFVNLSWE